MYVLSTLQETRCIRAMTRALRWIFPKALTAKTRQPPVPAPELKSLNGPKAGPSDYNHTACINSKRGAAVGMLPFFWCKSAGRPAIPLTSEFPCDAEPPGSRIFGGPVAGSPQTLPSSFPIPFWFCPQYGCCVGTGTELLRLLSARQKIRKEPD